ncbi:phospholipase ABHD3 [Chelonus insularis]|uniref:phospholipase ABHD3 n=1 Tax=Chelonus insularis TaxID=460826 RepID=UPI00158F5E7F|nr:phospholipase ABHD3 [Chelonus insularis]
MLSYFADAFELPKMYFFVLFMIGFYMYYIFEVVKAPQLVCAQGDFRKLIEENIDMINKKYWPTPWCFESRAQTIIASFLRGKLIPDVEYRRELLTLADGGQVALDWADDHCNSSSPIVIILPGLTGASQADYIKCLVSGARDIGIRCVIFNNRGLGGVALKTPRAYCAANCDDFTEVLDHVRKSHPNVPIGATGISMGGLVLGNYLAKNGEIAAQKLKAAFILSTPWNVFKGLENIESGINILLNRYLAEELSKVVQKMHYSKKSGVFDKDLTEAFKSKTLREFDAAFTTKHFGYRDVYDYYENATLHNKLHLIEVPVLCLNAADDPFQPLEAIPLQEASKYENIAFVITKRGGHIGFLEGLWPTQQEQYMTKLFKQYFHIMLMNKKNE